MVVFKSLCPSSSWTVRMSYPDSGLSAIQRTHREGSEPSIMSAMCSVRLSAAYGMGAVWVRLSQTIGGTPHPMRPWCVDREPSSFDGGGRYATGNVSTPSFLLRP